MDNKLYADFLRSFSWNSLVWRVMFFAPASPFLSHWQPGMCACYSHVWLVFPIFTIFTILHSRICCKQNIYITYCYCSCWAALSLFFFLCPLFLFFQLKLINWVLQTLGYNINSNCSAQLPGAHCFTMVYSLETVRVCCLLNRVCF